MKKLVLFAALIWSLTSLANVTSSFTADAVKGCSPLIVNLTDHSGGSITSRHWNLGNGNTSTQVNPSATYLNPGTYTITLVVSDGSRVDSSSRTITVFMSPSADFATDRITACPGDSIHFTNQAVTGSAPISHYAWGFGNGIASSDTNTKYGYSQSGTFSVTLVVQDTNGCDAHLTRTNFITIWPQPTAAFTASPVLTCGTSQSVTFSNQSTGNGLTYDWAFGDSTHSPSANPVHLYSYGKYVATLTAANSNGCKSKATQKIAVINVKADFNASKLHVCAGEAVTFYDLSPMPGTSWHWNFGDGTGSVKQNPTKIYTTPGVYSVSFTVNDAICSDSSTKVGYITVTTGLAVSFTADNQYSCTTPFPVNFTAHAPTNTLLTWSFGDGHISTITNPSNTYTTPSIYTVSLTAVDTSTGCTVMVSVPGFIHTSKPTVNFISDTLFCIGYNVSFYNRTLNGKRYLWNFGDGDTSTQYEPHHQYMQAGRYTVSLTAWDSIGCDTILVKPHLIHIDSTKVSFNVNERFSPCPPLVSVFSSQANRSDLKYLWDFGDGYTDTAANPTHIYFLPGIYTVKLTGSSKYGCSGSFTDSNLIVVQGPSGTFSINPNSGCIPVTVSFSGSASSNVQNVVCDLGDGTLYTDSLNFNYTYNSVSIFHPKFILTDHIGCSVPYSLDSIITHGRPVLSVKDTSICAGRNVKVDLGSDHYRWKAIIASECDTCDRQGNFCDTCSTVLLAPDDTTTYIVTATNIFGCAVTDSFKLLVNAIPQLISKDTFKLCKNASVQLMAMNKAYSATWTPALYLDNANVLTPTCTPATDMNYTVTAYNELGCSVSGIVPVRVYDRIPMAAMADTAVCAGSAVHLYAMITDTCFHSVNFSWQLAVGLKNQPQQDLTVVIPSETEKFTVIATSGSCIADTATVTVSVLPQAEVKLPGTITTTTLTELSIAPVSGDLVSYSWSAKNPLICDTCPATTIIPTESQYVYLDGTNQYSCHTRDSIFLHVLNCDPASIFVPNTFTPNGDGLNDRLYVRSKTLSQIDYFRLFNRWGAVVFETKNMSEGWDGNVNGKIAEQGVYVYQVSGKCENGYDVSTSGTVTLVR